MAVAGIAIGLPAAGGLSTFMSSLLYGVTSSDSLTYAVAAGAIAAAALLAGWIPALRASRVDPMETLRSE